jgi:flagellar hook assembly protein FlgD
VDPGPFAPASALLAARPNPFNPRTTITFAVRHPSRVRIVVYDLAARQVAAVNDQVYGAGTHEVEWNGKDASGRLAPSRTCLVRMEAPERIESWKVTLAR